MLSILYGRVAPTGKMCTPCIAFRERTGLALSSVFSVENICGPNCAASFACTITCLSRDCASCEAACFLFVLFLFDFLHGRLEFGVLPSVLCFREAFGGVQTDVLLFEVPFFIFFLPLQMKKKQQGTFYLCQR